MATTKKLKVQVGFWMNINDYNSLQKFFSDDERSMSGFLRAEIRKSLNINRCEIEHNIKQIMALGDNKRCKNGKKCNLQVNFLMNENELSAIKEYLKNIGIEASTFYRYLTKKELRRLDIEKEKNQTWDIE